MTEAADDEQASLDDVLEPEFDVPLPHRPGIHGGMPLRPDDDELAAAVERDRVAAGVVADYAPTTSRRRLIRCRRDRPKQPTWLNEDCSSRRNRSAQSG